VPFQSLHQVEIRAVEDGFNLLQPNAQLAEEQDLLHAE
jgi:hypothetical protein